MLNITPTLLHIYSKRENAQVHGTDSDVLPSALLAKVTSPQNDDPIPKLTSHEYTSLGCLSLQIMFHLCCGGVTLGMHLNSTNIPAKINSPA